MIWFRDGSPEPILSLGWDLSICVQAPHGYLRVTPPLPRASAAVPVEGAVLACLIPSPHIAEVHLKLSPSVIISRFNSFNILFSGLDKCNLLPLLPAPSSAARIIFCACHFARVTHALLAFADSCWQTAVTCLCSPALSQLSLLLTL